jgi:molybdopterin/thiamine biosynthesis adenylyltransferase
VTAVENESAKREGLPGVEAGLERYSRQVLLEQIGVEGQRRLLRSRATLIGCGALGSMLAQTLVRAGVGFLRIVDRDLIELNNLQRQVLFDEQDIAEELPKAEAARRKLSKINSQVEVEAAVADANSRTIEQLVAGSEILLDGTDNFETRFLMNDVAVKHGIPWVYGACIGTSGMMMAIEPGRSACLRCVFDDAPPAGSTATCETVGILGPVPHLVASLQAVEAIKILCGRMEDVTGDLISVDLWETSLQRINVRPALEKGDCLCCKHRLFKYLEGEGGSEGVALCGRDAVQVSPNVRQPLDLQGLAERLGGVAEVASSRFMVRFSVEGCQVAVFGDGRAIVSGTSDPGRARALYARYIGV